MSYLRNALVGAAFALLAGGLIMGAVAPSHAAGLDSEAEKAERKDDVPDLNPGNPGEALYKARCAACHDNPVDRTPGKATLAASSRSFIVHAMTNGLMRPQAEGLNAREMESIAAYLSRNAGGTVEKTALESPPCTTPAPPLDLNEPKWNGWGREASNPRYQPNPGLTAADVPKLKLKWAVGLSGARNGQPTIVGGRVFIANTSGAVYSLNAKTGCSYWRYNASGSPRTTITIAPLPTSSGPARYVALFSDYGRNVYAIDAESGAELWKITADTQSGAILTGSPTYHDGRLYVPVASAEEALATNDKYVCCKFRGAVVALDVATGKVVWKTYTIAEEAKPTRINPKGGQMWGPAGAGIWGAPTVDARRGRLYLPVGNTYTDVAAPNADAIVAMDLKTGAIVWSNQLTKDDTYIIGCYGERRVANCPLTVGPDHDFGASPILHDLPNGKQVILAGQKSGQVYALDPDNGGKVIWTRRLSPGGALGGVEFSLAADPATVYAPIADIFVRDGARPGLSALRISDGEVLWHTPSPVMPCRWKGPYCHPALSQAITVIPGVVFAGAMNGWLRAYDAKDGKVVWEASTAGEAHTTTLGGKVLGGVLDGGGPVVVDGMLYVPSGYAGREGGGSTVLLAYSVDGR